MPKIQALNYMKKYFCFLSMLIILISSCKKEQSNGANTLSNGASEVVLFERESKAPVVLSNKKSASNNRTLATSSTDEFILTPKDYLGRSYDAEVSDVGSPLGVRYPVVDMKRLLVDYSEFFKPITINNTSTNVFSFVSFDRYSQKSNTSKTVNAGFSLNIGLFSIGAKSKYVNTFSSSILNENKRVYGELDGYYIGTAYAYLFSSNMIDIVKQNYLSPTFLQELYNNSPYEFVKNYGTFVIKDFNTGGRVNALFTGLYTANADSTTQTHSMDNSINASFKFGKDTKNNVGGDIGKQNSNGGSIATQNNFSNIMVSLRTYGGSAGIDNFSVPQNIDQINFNLNNWGSSLNDINKNVLISFNDNGLVPITSFILESNLSSNINSYIKYGTGLKKRPLMEPVIEARWVFYHDKQGYFTTVLRTRFGDQIFLTNENVKWPLDGVDANGQPIVSQASFDKYLAKAKEIAQKKLPYYKLKVVALQPSFANASFMVDDYMSHIDFLNEASMKKYYDAKNKITYLYYSGTDGNTTDRKFAYSIHDDYIYDTYGIKEWVQTLPIVPLTYSELKKYEIVAL